MTDHDMKKNKKASKKQKKKRRERSTFPLHGRPGHLPRQTGHELPLVAPALKDNLDRSVFCIRSLKRFFSTPQITQ